MFGRQTIRRPARCPQIPEQKLVTERWLKEHQQHQKNQDKLFSPTEVRFYAFLKYYIPYF